MLRRLAHPDAPTAGPLRVVVAPVRSVLQPQLKGLGDLEPMRLARRRRAPSSTQVARRLADLAYARVDLVTKRGEFAVRGGILDVFPPTEEHPLRVEFWGDEVEEIRTFAVADQRTSRRSSGCGRRRAGSCCSPRGAGRAAALAPRAPQLAEMLDKLAEGIPVEGMESLAPAAGRRRLAGAAAALHARRARTCCSVTRSGSGPGRTTWCAPARSSWRRAGPPRPVGGKAPLDLGAGRLPHPGRGPRRRARGSGSRGGRCRPFGAGRRRVRRRRASRWPAMPDAAGVGLPTRRRARAGRPSRRRVPRRHPQRGAGPQAAGPATAGGWRWSSRAPAPPSGRWRCCATPGSGSGLADALEQAAGAADEFVVTTGALEHGFARRPAAAGGHSPATTSPAAGARPRRTCARCRAAGATRSTRWSCAPATSWCTSSTASAGTSRWCSAPSTARSASTSSSSTRRRKRGQPGDRLFVPTDSLDQFSRYVGGETPDPAQARRLRLAEGQGPGPQGGPGDRRPAHPALRRPQGHQGPRLRPGHPVAAGAGGRLPLHGDAGPARRHRRGQGATWSSRPRWTG